MTDFDHDLARLDQIRRAHKSARPTHEDPAWLNCHGNCGFLIGFIDNLWKTYSADGRKLDRAQAELGLARELLEQWMLASDNFDMNDWVLRVRNMLEDSNPFNASPADVTTNPMEKNNGEG